MWILPNINPFSVLNEIHNIAEERFYYLRQYYILFFINVATKYFKYQNTLINLIWFYIYLFKMYCCFITSAHRSAIIRNYHRHNFYGIRLRTLAWLLPAFDYLSTNWLTCMIWFISKIWAGKTMSSIVFALTIYFRFPGNVLSIDCIYRIM